MPKLTRVAAAGDIAPGTAKIVQAEGRTIAVFNCEGTFYAIDNTCLHRGGPLGEGDLEGTVVTCPWHGWRYDVSTGANVMNPAVRVATYPVRVEGGEVLVEV